MNHLTIGTVCACVCVLGCVAGAAQGPDEAAVKARLDQVASSYTPDNAFMGTVLVVDGDHVLLDKGYGMADLEWKIPNVPDAKFRLGSLTKQFTAALVLLVQQDGKLNINDPVSKYLPDARRPGKRSPWPTCLATPRAFRASPI